MLMDKLIQSTSVLDLLLTHIYLLERADNNNKNTINIENYLKNAEIVWAEIALYEHGAKTFRTADTPHHVEYYLSNIEIIDGFEKFLDGK